MIHHLNFLDNKLPDKCADLIIADPPYYKVKGKFDFIWKTFEDYLKDVEKWGRECQRLLKDNGTLLWYGHALKIAYTQIILDKYFFILNSLVWRKKESQVLKGAKNYRCFAPITERILMYSQRGVYNEWDKTGWDVIKNDVNKFVPLRKYFENVQEFIGLNKREINEKMGDRAAEHCFYHSSTQWDLPTEKTYKKIIKIFKLKEWGGFKEYEELRTEYEELRRPFYNPEGITDVLVFSQESHITKNYNHDTKKPETLTTVLIETCSRPDALVVVPFVGSGTECAMAARAGRKFEGYEINGDYVKIATERAEREKRQLKFNFS